MKCEKCGKEMKIRDGLLMSNPPKHGYDCECGHVDYQVAQVTLSTLTTFVTIPIEQFKQLETKATELDRRENGVAVSWSHGFPNCGKCDSPVDGKSTNYCGGCGTKLI
jgi:hypothetical protein